MNHKNVTILSVGSVDLQMIELNQLIEFDADDILQGKSSWSSRILFLLTHFACIDPQVHS